jgi:hypothetical protein
MWVGPLAMAIGWNCGSVPTGVLPELLELREEQPATTKTAPTATAT